jgi:hypothetical protein
MKKRADTAAISGACRKIALEAACHKKTIGKDLILVEMEVEGGAYCSFHSEGGAEVMILPDILTPQGGTTQVTVRTLISEDQVEFRFQAKVAKKKTG